MLQMINMTNIGGNNFVNVVLTELNTTKKAS